MNKIAIIEDDIDICNMIAKFLENNKYMMSKAVSFKVALPCGFVSPVSKSRF